MRAKLYRPIWSRQHGATILLGVSWLIATASTPRLSLAQPALLLALLSGFQVVEIGLAALRRLEITNARQGWWLAVYSGLAAASALAAVLLAPPLLTRAPWAAGTLAAALLVDRTGATKRALGELILFGALAAAGMLAYRPEAPAHEALSEAIPLWLVTWWYFALSIALVKYRLGRVSARAAFASTLIAAGAIAGVGPGLVSVLIPILILVKGAVWWVAARRIREMPLPALGLVETAAALVFALTVTLVMRAGWSL